MMYKQTHITHLIEQTILPNERHTVNQSCISASHDIQYSTTNSGTLTNSSLIKVKTDLDM